MKPIYKKVKVSLPHCPKCGEQLKGNNSLMMPYKCKCGIWKYNLEEQKFEINKLSK